MAIDNEGTKETENNNDAGEGAGKSAKRAAKKFERKIDDAEQTLVTSAQDFGRRAQRLFRNGEVDLREAFDVAGDWVAANPKVAIGALLGGGVFLGMLVSSRIGRVLVMSVLAVAARRYA